MSVGDRRTKCISGRIGKSEKREKRGPVKSNYTEAKKVGSFKKKVKSVQIVGVLKRLCLLKKSPF